MITEGATIEFNNNYLGVHGQRVLVTGKIFAKERDYEFETEFNGDPSLEIGDTILLEATDGYMRGVISSIQTKYDGSLKSTIKGECSYVLR